MRGRPAGSSDRDLSRSLLYAAASGLREKSHLDLTSREIASKAGTHPGMVNYYFAGKNGLLSELLNNISKLAHRNMRRVEGTLKPGVDPTEDMVRALTDAYYPHCDTLSVILIEMFRQDSDLRTAYMDQARERNWHIFPTLEAIIRRCIDDGTYKPELDPAMIAWTFLSLVSGPLILTQMSRANGCEREAPDADAWVLHVVGMIRAQVLPMASGTPH